MAKFTNGDLRLKDNQRVTFGDNLDSNLWWDGSNNELRLDTTISGVSPTEDYHLTTKQYVDAISGSIVVDHGNLTGLGDDDHLQYILVNGSRGFTSTVSGVDPVQSYELATKNYVDTGIASISGSIITDHGQLSGLSDDDHTQYVLVDGTRDFTGIVSYSSHPTFTSNTQLVDKQYVDSVAQNLDWQDSVINFQNTPPGSPSNEDRYVVVSGTGTWSGHDDDIAEWNGTSWDYTTPNEGFALWDETGDRLMVYNGSQWVRFGSTVIHGNLSGLQGGTTGQYFHLTQASYSALTSYGGVSNASSEHIHDDRYYTENEVDTISGSLQTQIDSINNDFDERAQDAVGTVMSGVGGVTVTYNDSANTITVSGVQGITDHGDLSGLSDDDHTQYIRVDGTRGFTATVSGIDPVQASDLATKNYVDNRTTYRIYEHGRQAISNGSSQVTVTFSTALSNTNYTVNVSLENTTDSPPSIYAFIVSSKTTTGFTVTFMGDIDSANYVLNWSVIPD